MYDWNFVWAVADGFTARFMPDLLHVQPFFLHHVGIVVITDNDRTGSSHSLNRFFLCSLALSLSFTLSVRVSYIRVWNEMQLTFCKNKTNICSNKFARTNTRLCCCCLLFTRSFPLSVAYVRVFAAVFPIHLSTVHAFEILGTISFEMETLNANARVREFALAMATATTKKKTTLP